uniref:Uncharacterized protein n=1 Tax=Salix viminalis TaxID=40686 RepID=A0A6N2MMI7_SALVM
MRALDLGNEKLGIILAPPPLHYCRDIKIGVHEKSIYSCGLDDDAVKLKSMEVLQEIQLAVRSIPYESGNADDLWCLLDIIRLVFGFY